MSDISELSEDEYGSSGSFSNDDEVDSVDELDGSDVDADYSPPTAITYSGADPLRDEDMVLEPEDRRSESSTGLWKARAGLGAVGQAAVNGRSRWTGGGCGWERIIWCRAERARALSVWMSPHVLGH